MYNVILAKREKYVLRNWVEGVKIVYRVFGRYDLVAHVETSGLDALPYVTDKIRAIEGVLSTESLIIHS